MKHRGSPHHLKRSQRPRSRGQEARAHAFMTALVLLVAFSVGGAVCQDILQPSLSLDLDTTSVRHRSVRRHRNSTIASAAWSSAAVGYNNSEQTTAIGLAICIPTCQRHMLDVLAREADLAHEQEYAPWPELESEYTTTTGSIRLHLRGHLAWLTRTGQRMVAEVMLPCKCQLPTARASRLLLQVRSECLCVLRACARACVCACVWCSVCVCGGMEHWVEALL